MTQLPAQQTMIGKQRARTEHFKKALLGYLSDWRLYVLLLPAIVYTFIFCYIPMYGVIIAFKDFHTSQGILASPWVGLKHFIRFIEFPNFWLIFWNTLRIGLYSFATFPCSIILALLLNELTSEKFKKTVQMITYAPYFLSSVVVCSMVILFLNQDSGIINNILAVFGLHRIQFMAIPHDFDHIYVWSGVWQGIGFGTIIYLAALSSISPELVEAARVEGANRLHIIRHVNLPGIMPTIIILVILASGGVLSVSFEKVFLLQNPLILSRSQVISTYVYEIGIKSAQFSYSSAIGLFNTIISVAVLLGVNAMAKRVSGFTIW